jgi:hypothetical protein
MAKFTCAKNDYLRERLKIKLSNLGLVKIDKQLDERKLRSIFAKPQKQIGMVYFSSIPKRLVKNHST